MSDEELNRLELRYMSDNSGKLSDCEHKIKKKRKKLKALRKELADCRLGKTRSDSDEIQELRQIIKHRENTIQELLTLRMFLRSSIEWVKESVAENFPVYNSFLYTLMFSNFGLFLTNSFIDFTQNLNNNTSSDDGVEIFWIPYIVWAVCGIVGWLFDMYVSKKKSISKKLNSVHEATFGTFSLDIMRNAIQNSEQNMETVLLNNMEGPLHPLGSGGV